MVFSQINGVNMMLLFGPSILQEAGIGDASQAIFFTIFLNVVILVSTIVAFWLVQRFGRRPIMIWGVTAMTAGHLMMAANFYFGGSPYINLLAMFVAAGAFTLSLAPLSWVIVSEIFPNQVRAKALSIVCVMLYLSSFLCAQFFPMITEAFQKAAGHPGGAYLIFAGICGACVLFCWKLLPETKDLTLEDIGRFWLRLKEKGRNSLKKDI
jgi:MFS family permease